MFVFECLDCNKNYKRKFEEDLTKRLGRIYRFYGDDINNFCLMLQKGVFPYEYLDSWQKLDQGLFPEKKEFYSNLNVEDIQMQTRGMQNEFVKNLK